MALVLETFEIVVLYCFNCGDICDSTLNKNGKLTDACIEHTFIKLNFGRLIPDDKYDHDYDKIYEWGVCLIKDGLNPEHD